MTAAAGRRPWAEYCPGCKRYLGKRDASVPWLPMGIRYAKEKRKKEERIESQEETCYSPPSKQTKGPRFKRTTTESRYIESASSEWMVMSQGGILASADKDLQDKCPATSEYLCLLGGALGLDTCTTLVQWICWKELESEQRWVVAVTATNRFSHTGIKTWSVFLNR